MKHPKLYYGDAPLLDPDVDAFDDRTLATFVGQGVAHPDDEMADVLRSLERWRDRGMPK